MGKLKNWIITKLGGVTAEQYKSTDDKFWKYKYKCEDLEDKIKKMHPFAMQPIIEYARYEPKRIVATYERTHYKPVPIDFAKQEIAKSIMREIVTNDLIVYEEQCKFERGFDEIVGSINIAVKVN